MRSRRTALIWAAALLLAACGGEAEDSAVDGAETATTLAGGDAATETTADPATAATVQVADDDEFGPILVGPNGHTLYLFERDQGTTTACTDRCAQVWPALAASVEPSAGDGVDASMLSTADAQVPDQVVYNGHLLYFYAQDMAPGEVKGIEIPAWFPVSPEGNKVERPQS